MATMTVATTPRLPSTRPIDYRWDRSRGIVLQSPRRTWKPGNGIMFALPTSRRSYATREIGGSTAQRTSVKSPAGSSTYLDNAHRTPGFGGSSLKRIEELSAKVKQLEAADSRWRQDIAILRDKDHSKDALMAKHERQVKDSRQLLEQAKVAHRKEKEKLQAVHQEDIQKLQNSNRQEKESRTLELQTMQKQHAQELQDVRESAGLAEDSPLLKAAFSRGEEAARQRYNQQVRDIEQQHELELKREKGLRADLENTRRRTENENAQKVGQEAATLSTMREEMHSLRQQKIRAESESEAERERNDRVRAHNVDLQRRLDGRKTRTQEDRRDYFGYRELFHAMDDQVYDVLAGATWIREDLEKEYQFWRKSVNRFQQDKGLLFFRQQPRYNTLKQSINEFLEGRAREAEAAAIRTVETSGKLLETRKSLKLQSHASRMVTKYLHFDKEPTEVRGVRVAHYMSLVLPFQQRLNECQKQLDAVDAEIRALGDESSSLPADLQHEHARLKDREKMISNYLKYADAFRYQESMAALLNSSPEDRITFVRMRARRERFFAMVEAANKAEEVHGRSDMGAIRRQLSRAKDLLEQQETFVRTRVIVLQDIGQLDGAVIAEADQELHKRLALHKRDADMALDVIAGQRKSLARNYKERKLELSKSATTTSSVSRSIEDVAASLKRGIKPATARSDVVHPVGHVVHRVVRKPLPRAPHGRPGAPTVQSRLLGQQKKLAVLAGRARHAKDHVIDRASRVLLKEQIRATQKKIMELQAERLLTSEGLAKTERRAPRMNGQSEDRGDEPSGHKTRAETQALAAGGGLKLTPTHPMQAPDLTLSRDLSKNEEQVSRWSTLTHALKSSSDATSNNLPQSSSGSSLQPVLKTRRPHKSCTNTAAEAKEVSTATPVDQLASRDASSPDATQTQKQKQKPDTNTTTSAEPHASPYGIQELNMPLGEHSCQESNLDTDAVSLPSSLSSYAPSDTDDSESADNLGSPLSPEVDAEWQPEAHTILDYQIPQKAYRDAVMASTSSNAAFWTHQLYKSSEGKTPVVYYCKSLETAERQCKLFLGESVLGFDLEWETSASLHKSSVKKYVSLIQLASEDKICLIHVACFVGEKAEQLLPPSLRTILEDVNIVKAGVNISGDANRMRHCFAVDMKGVFELSHMYRLVKTPDQVSFKLVGLAALVQNTLLLPLKKDDVRVSAWSRTLNAQQCAYAAADAYAGFRLFHQLDNLRKDLRPTPPRPAFFETYKPIILGDGTSVERTTNKPRTGMKKAAASGDLAESDDEFFDAPEELPDTYELDAALVKDGKVDIDEADPESVAVLRDMLQKTSLGESPLIPDCKESNKTIASTRDTQARPKQSPHILVASTETILADMWIASLPSRNSKVGAASLRAYHLWHHQNHSLDAVAGYCRQPPLALTTVASYIMTVVKEEDMPYDIQRLKEAFAHLPKSVWHVYGKWVTELGLDK